LPSLEALYPSKRDPAVRRSARLHSSSPSKPEPAPNKKTTKPLSPDISLAWLATIAKQRVESDERRAARARTDAMLNEDIQEFEYDDEDRWDKDAENALGKESSDKLKAVLQRIGGDLNLEGGFRFIRHTRQERTFDKAWIKDAEWLMGFDGCSSE